MKTRNKVTIMIFLTLILFIIYYNLIKMIEEVKGEHNNAGSAS